jgi:hypothetical protein
MTELFDRALLRARLARHSETRPAAIEQHVAAEMGERLSLINRSFDKTLLVAHHSQQFAEVLKRSGKTGQIDIIPPPDGAGFTSPAPAYNAIFHLLDLHAVNDVPGLLVRLRQLLLPDGLLMLACFGGETLTELRNAWLAAEEQLTGAVSLRVAPMINVRDMGTLLQHAGLALPVVDKDRHTVRYADPFLLMLELRAFGLTNIMHERSRKPVTRNMLGEVAAAYQQAASDADGRIRATVEIIWATGWAPHESQQKPLKPGSAQSRLADALKAKETKL